MALSVANQYQHLSVPVCAGSSAPPATPAAGSREAVPHVPGRAPLGVEVLPNWEET